MEFSKLSVDRMLDGLARNLAYIRLIVSPRMKWAKWMQAERNTEEEQQHVDRDRKIIKENGRIDGWRSLNSTTEWEKRERETWK